jgi:hypothetical protein
MRIQRAMREARSSRNCGKNAPISQQLGDFFTVIVSVLVKVGACIYSAELGMTDQSGIKSRKSQS